MVMDENLIDDVPYTKTYLFSHLAIFKSVRENWKRKPNYQWERPSNILIKNFPFVIDRRREQKQPKLYRETNPHVE